jgi:hypothetical protein
MRKGRVAEPTFPPKMSYNRMKAFSLEIQAQQSFILSFAEFSFAALRLPTRVLAQKNKSTPL